VYTHYMFLMVTWTFENVVDLLVSHSRSSSLI